MKRAGLLHHPKLPESLALAQEMARHLEERGVSPWLCSAWDENEIACRVGDFDLLITLGGDGTILRAARVAAEHSVPILGLNLGRVGFLAEMERGDWPEKLSLVLEGKYWLEERMMLQAEWWREGNVTSWAGEVLNEFVVGRGTLARIVRLATYIDGEYLTTYAADGLIVATATGSTAYALAVGGPILPPELNNILLIPIAPHLCLDRAVVLSQGARVEVQVSTDHRAILTVDGQFDVELKDADRVVITASPHACRFIRTQDKVYFYRTLVERLR
ncbi:MAG: NAD(+)/NADH kinase [Anaerolineales bacterium]|nr:NAD(+)/NADH kinase [Anaerolineales bacterium]